MIDPALQATALKSVHFMTIQARAWAYDEESHKRIADLLDDVEYLIALLFEAEDRTDDFLGYLEESAKRHQCQHAFDMMAQQVEATHPGS
jgi:hypothetical protein